MNYELPPPHWAAAKLKNHYRSMHFTKLSVAFVLNFKSNCMITFVSRDSTETLRICTLASILWASGR